MKQVTYDLIMSFSPCYDPVQYISKSYKDSLIGFLNNDKIPFQDRLWLVLRTDFVSEKLMRLFAVWSYRQTLKFITNPDPRSVEAANISEKYALGLVTKEELSAAESAAWSARSAAGYARSARSARSAAWSAAWSAAESAARSAAESAAWSAWSAWSAAESAAESERSAAESAAWSAQKAKLIEMITEEAIEMITEEAKESK